MGVRERSVWFEQDWLPQANLNTSLVGEAVGKDCALLKEAMSPGAGLEVSNMFNIPSVPSAYL